MSRSRSISPQLATSAVVLALAAALLAVPGAAADTQTTTTDAIEASQIAVDPLAASDPPGATGLGQSATKPHALPSPGWAGTGVHTDACDSTTTPGWLNTTGPVLTANATSPQVRFVVWDETTLSNPQLVFDQRSTVAADNSVRITATGLTDGHSYAWQAWPKPGTQGTPSAKCHFRVDTSVPILSVSTGPVSYAGLPQGFSFTGTGGSSGVACFHYVLNGALTSDWTCQSPNSVAADANGNGGAQVVPSTSGTNTLTVQAINNAGTRSQPVSHSFTTKPVVAAAVDGDAIPDILVPDSAGNLQIIKANATTTAPSSTVSAFAAPTAQDPSRKVTWNDYQLTYREWRQAPNFDDLIAHQPGSPYLYQAGNTGDSRGYFNGTVSILTRPTSCGTAGCPASYISDWTHSAQIVELDQAGLRQPPLISNDDGNLWLFTRNLAGNLSAAYQLSTTGSWAGYDLIMPGKDAAGNQALWARNRTNGALIACPIPLKADGSYDYSALTDPANGTVLGHFPVSAYPVLSSSGDGDGDGTPDLWAVTPDRHLLTFNGVTNPKDLGVLN